MITRSDRMPGYLNYLGYFLNFFKQGNRANASAPTACCTPPRRNDRTNANDPTAYSGPPKPNNRICENDPTACSTPPRRCNSVIENHRLKEDIAQQKSIFTHCAPNCCYSNNILYNPASYGHFLNPNQDVHRHSNEGFSSPRDSCINNDVNRSHYLSTFTTLNEPLQFPVPPCARRQSQSSYVEQPLYGLKRSFSLESCCPTEDRMRLASRKTLQMRHILRPLDSAGGVRLSLDSGKDYTPHKLIDLTPAKQSESSIASQNIVLEDHHPKSSRIPTYSKKYPPPKVSKSLPQPLESTEAKEPACLCYREILSTRPLPKGWRAAGHAYYCPKSVVAYRSYLNTRLENLFKVISKKKYCGNIIDAASHSRWMKLADVGVDEDAGCFKKFAKGRVVLPVSEYKKALKNICSEKNLDYWDLIKIMTDIELMSPDSNSSINGWKGSSN